LHDHTNVNHLVDKLQLEQLDCLLRLLDRRNLSLWHHWNIHNPLDEQYLRDLHGFLDHLDHGNLSLNLHRHIHDLIEVLNLWHLRSLCSLKSGYRSSDPSAPWGFASATTEDMIRR